jgi:hypothetical protein
MALDDAIVSRFPLTLDIATVLVFYAIREGICRMMCLEKKQKNANQLIYANLYDRFLIVGLFSKKGA